MILANKKADYVGVRVKHGWADSAEVPFTGLKCFKSNRCVLKKIWGAGRNRGLSKHSERVRA